MKICWSRWRTKCFRLHNALLCCLLECRVAFSASNAMEENFHKYWHQLFSFYLLFCACSLITLFCLLALCALGKHLITAREKNSETCDNFPMHKYSFRVQLMFIDFPLGPDTSHGVNLVRLIAATYGTCLPCTREWF